MLTWPTYGGRFFRQTNGRASWVIKIVKGGLTWLFSDTDMQLTDGHVYPLLASDPSIENAVDYVTKEWSVQDVRVEIANIKYRQNTAGTWVSFPDEISLIRAGAFSVYVLAGMSPTALSDGLLIFSGEISEPAVVSNTSVSIIATDGARRKNATLPQTYITGSPAPQRKSPIIYGNYTKSYDSSVDLGIVVCEPLNGLYGTNYLVAGHPCHTLSSAFWGQAKLPDPSLLISPTLTANDSGRCTLNTSDSSTAPYVAMKANAYMSVEGQYRGNTTDGLGYDAANLSHTIEPQKAWDNDLTTYATVIDDINGTAVNAHAYFGWPDYDSTDHFAFNEIGRQTGELITGVYYGHIDYRIVKPDFSATAYIQLLGLDGGAIQETITSDYPSTLSFNFITSFWYDRVHWHLRTGRNTVTGLDTPVAVVIRMDTTKTPSTPGREVFRVKYIRLRLQFVPRFPLQHFAKVFKTNFGGGGYSTFWDQPKPTSFSQTIGLAAVTGFALAAVKGRMFGSWIDEGGRSNSYNANDLIEDPAFIIESILRDELGFTSSQIDTASFDAAAYSNVKARLHISSDNEADAFSFIRQLTEQSTFAFSVSGVSKPRLVALNTVSPTIARTLTISDIDINSIVISKESKVINDIKVKHRWMEEYGDYVSYSTFSDSSSQAELGKYTQEFSWPNITEEDAYGSVTEVATFMKQVWAIQNTTISVTCPGIRNCDLEIGDWIQLDSTTINPHMLCFGSSWAGKKFLISRIRHTPSETTFEAVNIAI